MGRIRLRSVGWKNIDLDSIDRLVKRVRSDDIGWKDIDLIDIDAHCRFDSGDGDCCGDSH